MSDHLYAQELWSVMQNWLNDVASELEISASIQPSARQRAHSIG
jgi:hypothetical protein